MISDWGGKLPPQFRLRALIAEENLRYGSPALCALCVTFITAQAMADPRDDAAAGISRCASYPDNRDYLQCVYGAVQPLRASLGLSPALPAQQRLVPQMQQHQTFPPASAAPAMKPGPQESGLLGKMFGAGEPQLRMSAYNFDKRGLFTVTLSDGEVWQQVANDISYAQFGGNASDYIVSLTQGEFGNFKMDVRGEPGSFTVRRLR